MPFPFPDYVFPKYMQGLTFHHCLLFFCHQIIVHETCCASLFFAQAIEAIVI